MFPKGSPLDENGKLKVVEEKEGEEGEKQEA
jgi:hypothetical protein